MEYDPIMCMMVDKTTSVKTKDASWKAWTLYINGKFAKSFTSEMPPIREASEFMRENYPGKVGKLARNTGSSSGYTISGKDSNNLVDKAIRITDAEKFQNASGTILGEIVTKSGNKVVVRDPWGGEYRLSENDFNWLVRQRNTVPLDIRAVAEVKLN